MDNLKVIASGHKTNKRGQMKLSFGMIFSIVLIIVFVAFTFFAVKTMLSTGLTAQVGQFKEELQSDIDVVWHSSQSSKQEEYYLPNKIEHICFVDYASAAEGVYSEIYNELQVGYYGSENLFFYPSDIAPGVEIKHIALEEVIFDQNPHCIKNEESKIKLTLSKSFNETLVSIDD